ncbi:MAG: protein-methionine-sulfoxide reductase catalytic subunit MsrP [Alphaproteobacteria bacterium HGW-Alphaproteobacteria-4]|nr:MAG: protein-methionine-sulfoxide reductase catalytic subunit MsrP [Alphaproteobacteria bacterium HGW-Alphaproteobacteria-4]
MTTQGPKLSWADVTPKAHFLNRRAFMTAAAGVALAGPVAAGSLGAAKSRYSTDAAPNPLKDITGYSNYYEFGYDKTDPERYAGGLTIDPWSVEVGGLVERPGHYDLADIQRGKALEERIYRLRCVEAWAMVVPWVGFELSAFLAQVGVLPGAKYVAFETLVRPEEMPGQRGRGLDWPYREGLRLDEAMHPLTILASGLYDEPLPKGNGAPLRLVVPWKYGFKSIKAIVKMTLTDTQPDNTWRMQQAREYGFYANVNPAVDHPRWSQATERKIGAGLFGNRQPTLLFNGYADQVAGLYAGMDLAKNY